MLETDKAFVIKIVKKEMVKRSDEIVAAWPSPSTTSPVVRFEFGSHPAGQMVAGTIETCTPSYASSSRARKSWDGTKRRATQNPGKVIVHAEFAEGVFYNVLFMTISVPQLPPKELSSVLAPRILLERPDIVVEAQFVSCFYI